MTSHGLHHFRADESFSQGDAREFFEAREFSLGAARNPASDASRAAKHKLNETMSQ
jgi:hypothetical protein